MPPWLRFAPPRAPRTLAAFVAFATLALVSACGSPFPHADSADVAKLHPTDPSARVEDLERGRTLYMGKCGSCHMLHPPATIAPDAWPGKVMRMQNEGRVHLADDELRDIIRYVRAASLGSR